MCLPEKCLVNVETLKQVHQSSFTNIPSSFVGLKSTVPGDYPFVIFPCKFLGKFQLEHGEIIDREKPGGNGSVQNLNVLF